MKRIFLAVLLGSTLGAYGCNSGGGGKEAPVSETKEALASETKEAPASETINSAIAQIDKFIASKGINKSAPGWRTKLPKPPKANFGAGNTEYFWNVETNKGLIKVRLWPDIAPMHVSSTIYLTRLGFYDTLPFHRVITGFMAQGGCPLGTGTGGPGYKYAGEFSP